MARILAGVVAALLSVSFGRAPARAGAVGGAEDRPRRFASAEAILAGRVASTDLFEQAADRVAKELQPMEGPGTTAAYRRDLTRALVLRALEEAAT